MGKFSLTLMLMRIVILASDIPVAMLPQSGKISLLQLDGIVSPKTLKEAFKVAKIACEGRSGSA